MTFDDFEYLDMMLRIKLIGLLEQCQILITNMYIDTLLSHT